MKQLIKTFVDEFDIKIHNDKLYTNLLLNPSLRAGETYMDRWWDCDRLDELFDKIGTQKVNKQGSKNIFGLISSIIGSVYNFQTKIHSQKNAEFHYNLGNDLYETMLGKSMAYSCGYWKTATTLDQAQRDKYDLICRKVDLKKGDRVLDIGCGFGGFAKHAAENYGCEVVGINVSREQVKYAQNLCKGLPVSIHLTDYRDEINYNPNQIKFDKIISIGMFEHVGYKNYRTFMKLASKNLKEDGLFLLHTIGGNESQTSYDPWYNKYIFPNALIPSMQQITQGAEGIFIVEDWHNFGPDYDKTLLAWFGNFEANWPKLKSNYDEKFYRMWKYYLLSCAGLFRSRSVQLWQIVLSNSGVRGGYQSIR